MLKIKTVSLVLPAFNEQANISQAVVGFKHTGLFLEILVVDNNSIDKTAVLAGKAGAKVISETRQGYGFALRRGLAAARGDLIILSEPDGTFLPSEAKKIISGLNRFDLVLGTRTNPKYIRPGANMGVFLRFGNIFVAKIIQFLYHTPSLSDCGCTFRGIRRSGLKLLLPYFTVGGSYFLPEMVMLAARSKLNMVEIPVSYGPRIGRSKITGSRARSLSVGLQMFGLVLRSFARQYIH